MCKCTAAVSGDYQTFNHFTLCIYKLNCKNINKTIVITMQKTKLHIMIKQLPHAHSDTHARTSHAMGQVP